MNWLLIILIGANAHHVEFYTQAACERAAQQVEARHSSQRINRAVTAFCAERGYQSPSVAPR